VSPPFVGMEVVSKGKIRGKIGGQKGEFPGNELGKWELSGKPLNYRSSISIHEGQPLYYF